MIHGETLGRDLQALLGDDEFHARHIGPGGAQEAAMLAEIARLMEAAGLTHAALRQPPGAAIHAP
jgi:hypothetical protein